MTETVTVDELRANVDRLERLIHPENFARFVGRSFEEFAAEATREGIEAQRAWNNAKGNRRRARVRYAKGRYTIEQWQELLALHGGKCVYCGSSERIEAEHRIPLCRGGSNDISNIVPACQSCNRWKNRRTEAEFRAILAAADAGAREGDACVPSTFTEEETSA